MYKKVRIYFLKDSNTEKQILFTAYVKNKEIKLSKKKIEQIFFEKEDSKNLFLREDINFYKKENMNCEIPHQVRDDSTACCRLLRR